jgi:hypothetical protein
MEAETNFRESLRPGLLAYKEFHQISILDSLRLVHTVIQTTDVKKQIRAHV